MQSLSYRFDYWRGRLPMLCCAQYAQYVMRVVLPDFAVAVNCTGTFHAVLIVPAQNM